MRRLPYFVFFVVFVVLNAMACDPPPTGEGEGESEGEGEQAPAIDITDGTVVLVRNVIDDFVGRAIVNPTYNGWFSNRGLDVARLKTCLVHQVLGALSFEGAPYNGTATVNGLQALYPDDNATYSCRSMAEAHAGLNIPSSANAALVGDVLAAMTAQNVPQDVQNIIVEGLGPQFADIIDEDQDDDDNPNQTAYNFLGGKPAILALLNGADCDPQTDGDQPCFLARVLADNTINGFFATANQAAVDRLIACLQRQISGDIAGGPDDYDNANFIIEPALQARGQCANMLDAHKDLGITDAQFEALDVHAATALTLLLGNPADGKARAIIDAVVAALTGQGICQDIVEQADEAAACAQFDPQNDPDAP